MAEVNLGDIIRIAIKFYAPEINEMLNVFTHKLTLPLLGTDETSLLDLAQSLLEDLYSHIKDSISSDVSALEAEVVNVTQDKVVGTVVPDFDGSSIDDTLPGGVAAVVAGIPSKTGSRARKFIPGTNDNSVINNLYGSTTAGRLAAWATQWLNGYTKLIGGSLHHLQSGLLASQENNEFYDLKEVRISLVPGYQRRRKPGVGE